MLQTLRDRMSGPVFWAIIAILILPFAIWGIGVDSFFGGGADPTLAKIGDAKITQSQFQNAYNQAYAQLVESQGDNFRADSVDQKQLKHEVLQNLIQQSVLQQYAHRLGYRADDVAVYDYLSVFPAFQDNGRFSMQAYRRALAGQGLTPTAFESQVRASLSDQQLRDAVLQSTFVTPKQALASWRLLRQTRSFNYVPIDPTQYLNQINVSDAEARAYYQAHAAQYRAPARIKLAYVELAKSQLPKASPPSQDVLKAIYDAQKDSRFTTPEERRASHILIQFGADPQAALKKAEAVAAKLKQGADFAQLAKQYSDDTFTKNKGGDLGWIRRGMIDPSFEKALFALAKAGDVSQPVKTKFGWDVIRLDAIRPKTVEPFDDPKVQAQLLATYQNRDLAKRFQEKLDRMGELAFENSASLEPVAKALELPVQQTEWFTRKGGRGIAAQQDVIKAAFSDDVLNAGDNSKPIRVGEDDVVVIRKAGYQPARQQTFEEVRQQVIDALKQQKAAAMAHAEAQRLLAAVRGGTALTDAAKADKLTVQTQDRVLRDAKGVDSRLLRAVFRMPRPAGDHPSLTVADLGDGKVAVIALRGVDDGGMPSTRDDAFRQEITTERDAQAGAEFAAYRKMMERSVRVTLEAAPQTPDTGAS